MVNNRKRSFLHYSRQLFFGNIFGLMMFHIPGNSAGDLFWDVENLTLSQVTSNDRGSKGHLESAGNETWICLR